MALDKKIQNKQKKLIEIYRQDPVIAAMDLLERDNEPLRLAPHQRIILRDLWTKNFGLLILTRGGSKTFLVALFLILKAMLYPREKCMIVAPSFRQVKRVFREIERFYDESPYLKQSCKKPTSVSMEKCYLEFTNISYIVGYPLGSGDKVRGERATTIVIDEAGYMDKQIVDVVIKPMLITKYNPMAKNTTRANTVVMASSATYQFMWLYEQYLRYQDLTNPQSKNYNSKYGLYVFDVDDMPEGWIDQEMFLDHKETMTEMEFLKEYYCFVPGTRVRTINGYENIEKIKEGNLVYSHLGRYKQVLKTGSRIYSGPLVEIKLQKSTQPILCTPEHKILVKAKETNNVIWKMARDITLDDWLAYPVVRNTYIKDYEYIDMLLYKPHNDLLYFNKKGRKWLFPRNKYYEHRLYRGLNSYWKSKKKKIPRTACPDFVVCNDQLMRLIGFYITNGFAGRFGETVSYVFDKKNQKHIAEKVYEDYHGVFGQYPVYERKVLGAHNYGTERIHIRNSMIGKFFENNFGGIRSNKNKKIPSWIMFLPHEKTKELLKAILSALISLQKEVTKKIILSEVSEDVALRVRDLCLKHGIVANIIKAKNEIYNLEIAYPETLKCYDLIEKEYENKKVLMPVRKYIDNQYLFTKVMSVRTIDNYNGHVYNIEVREDNSFCLCDSAVKNCIFPEDSKSFFKMSDFEKCKKSYVQILKKNPSNIKGKYVIGVDVAREYDDFSIVIIRVDVFPNEVVFALRLNNAPFPDMLDTLRKVIDRFEQNKGEIMFIYLDAFGGGTTIRDGLLEKCVFLNEEGQWVTQDAFIDPDDKRYENLPGRRILKMFTNSIREINEINYGLRNDLEKCNIAFPSRLYDENDEDMYLIFNNINEIINQTTKVETKALEGGLLRFDTPGRIKKDLYTAFLLAAYAARVYRKPIETERKKLAHGLLTKAKILGR